MREIKFDGNLRMRTTLLLCGEVVDSAYDRLSGGQNYTIRTEI